ncbi:carbohydrate ABC transporter permease [Streptomyces sp. NPDC091376]|uniref:carbohydrate ABC transporter permease n=1 Tax=Streptomyces sp. NPDC091376 TaxID=3365994 RepID=UPI00382BD2A8
MRQGSLRFAYGFLAAPALLYAVFVIGPYLQAFYIALTDWRGVSSRAEFVGLDNFARILDDEVFWQAIRNHGVILLVVPALTIGIALAFAFLLNVAGGRGRSGAVRGLAGAGFYRVVFFFPQVLSIVVTAVLFQSMYRPDEAGGFNSVLGRLGISPVGFLTDPSFALWSLMAVMIWSGVGFYLVLFQAGMAAIPTELYEAAALEGAGRKRTFVSITLPLLRNTLQLAWVYMGIGALDAFALIQVLAMEHGGPDHATTVVGLQVWERAFEHYQFGQASALGVVLFFVVMTFAAVTMRVTRREAIEY